MKWKFWEPSVDLIEKEELLSLLQRAVDNNDALINGYGEVNKNYKEFQQQVVVLLGAIALQHGGSLKIKQEFISAISSQENTMRLEYKKNEDGSSELNLITAPPQEEKVGETT